ncbi:hypothetical protein EBU94_00680, partial [bacterium]|nr:hypothetical protein [bacterium]
MSLLKYNEFVNLYESNKMKKQFDTVILDIVMQNIQKCLKDYETKIPSCTTGIEYMSSSSSAQTAVIKVKTNMGRGDLQKYLKTALSDFNYNVEIKQTSTVKYGLFFKYPEENKPEKQLKNISITVKPQGRATEPDPNEAMVACLLLMGKKQMEAIIESGDYLDTLIEEAIKQQNKIKGGNTEIFNFFKGEYVNIVQAISATRAIQTKFPNIPNDVFLTGGSFPKEIDFLSVNNYMGLLFDRSKTGFINPINKNVDGLIKASNGLMCLKNAIMGAFMSPASILSGLALVAGAMVSAIISSVTAVIYKRVNQIINSVLSPIR